MDFTRKCRERGIQYVVRQKNKNRQTLLTAASKLKLTHQKQIPRVWSLLTVKQIPTFSTIATEK